MANISSAPQNYLKEDPDIELMLKFQSGDTRAFEELVKKYQSPILNTIYRYIGDRTEAEDLAQEVFLRVFNARKIYRPTNKFSHWIFTIATNLCLNQIRNTKRHRSRSLFQGENNPQVNLPDSQGRVSDHFKKLELKIAVREALNSLPPNQRMVVVLNKYENYTYEDIARIMRLSLPAVKSLLFRAREGLKKRLQKYIE